MPATKKHTKATASASHADTSSLPGFAPWITSTSLINGGDLAQIPKFNAETGGFAHTVTIKHNDAFELEPLTITNGPLRGSRVLVLKPFTKYFRFLELPLEIRRMIYDELLLDSEPVQISSVKLMDEPRRAYSPNYVHMVQHSHKLSIMAVNRQIFQEASPTLYSGNIFKFYKFSECLLFLNDIGMMRNHLRHVAFGDHAYQKTKARGMFFKLKDVKGIRSITFSHREFDVVSIWRRHTCTVDQLAGDCKTMLSAFQKSRGESSNLPSVLDLIKISWRVCYDCRKGTNPASVKTCQECTKKPQVCRSFEMQVRQAVAEALELEE